MILPRAYISAAFSSKRRMCIIVRSSAIAIVGRRLRSRRRWRSVRLASSCVPCHSVQKWIASPSTASAASFTHLAERRMRGDGPAQLARRRLQRHRRATPPRAAPSPSARSCGRRASRRYAASATILIRPSVWFIAFARPFARTGNLPDLHLVAGLARLRLGQADAGDLGLAVGRARHVLVVQVGRLDARRAARRRITPCADATCARFMMPVTSPIA